MLWFLSRFYLSAQVCSCSNNSDKEIEERAKISRIQQGVYQLSDNIRFVDIASGDTPIIYVYVYEEYIELDEDNLREQVSTITYEQELINSDDSCIVMIEDIGRLLES